jgi:Flp pilus assembly protein TadG
LAVPILLVIILGTIEAGRLLFIYSSIAAAGREAARYAAGVGENGAASALYNDCSGIRAAAMRIGFMAGVKASDITLSHDSGPGTSSTPYCTATSDTVNLKLGDRILVNLTTSYSPLVPLVPIPPMSLHSHSVHTVLKAVEIPAYTPVAIPGGSTCDVSNYLITVSQPTGPTVNVTLKNLGPDITITNLLVVWDTSSGPVLQSITGLAAPNSAGPSYSKDVNWDFPTGQRSFSLGFSRTLKNNVIIRLTLSDSCSFGQ